MNSSVTAAKHTPTLDALEEYLQLLAEVGELENREHECECDSYNFHTCSLCKESQEKLHRSKVLLDLWGENWAVLLKQFLTANAAAPALLEALKAMVANANWELVPASEQEFDAMIAKAEAAIQKATEGQ